MFVILGLLAAFGLAHAEVINERAVVYGYDAPSSSVTSSSVSIPTTLPAYSTLASSSLTSAQVTTAAINSSSTLTLSNSVVPSLSVTASITNGLLVAPSSVQSVYSSQSPSSSNIVTAVAAATSPKPSSFSLSSSMEDDCTESVKPIQGSTTTTATLTTQSTSYNTISTANNVASSASSSSTPLSTNNYAVSNATSSSPSSTTTMTTQSTSTATVVATLTKPCPINKTRVPLHTASVSTGLPVPLKNTSSGYTALKASATQFASGAETVVVTTLGFAVAFSAVFFGLL